MRKKAIGIRSRRKRAAAVVEFAVVAPLLFTILFGIIEYGYIFMVRQTLIHATREGARVAVLQSTTAPYTEVIDRVDDVMSAAGVSGYTLAMTHFTPAEPMETVRVTIPLSQVSLLGNMFHDGSEMLEASCSMRREGIGAPPPGS